MRSEIPTKGAGQLEPRSSHSDLLNAVEKMPNKGKAALVLRLMKEVVAGTISPAEANEITKRLKT